MQTPVVQLRCNPLQSVAVPCLYKYVLRVCITMKKTLAQGLHDSRQLLQPRLTVAAKKLPVQSNVNLRAQHLAHEVEGLPPCFIVERKCAADMFPLSEQECLKKVMMQTRNLSNRMTIRYQQLATLQQAVNRTKC